MSVNPIAEGRSEGRAGKDSYDNLETQMITETIEVGDAQLDATTQRWGDEQPYRVPNAAGLDRGEVAELVGYNVMDMDLWFQNPATDIDSTGTATWETFGTIVGNLPDNVLRNDEKIENDGGNGQNLSVTDREILDGAIFYARVSSYNGYTDSTNATGGSGSFTSTSPEFVNFRDSFGLGPLMFSDDRWWHEFALNSYQNDGTKIFGKLVYQLYWDIWERQDVLDLVDL